MKRLENESYEEFRKRRKKAQLYLKIHLRGQRTYFDRKVKRNVKLPIVTQADQIKLNRL